MRKESIIRRGACLLCGFGPISMLIFALLSSSPMAMASFPSDERYTVQSTWPNAGITFMGLQQVAQRNTQNDRFRNRYEQWQNMKPDEKETLRRRMDQWNRMAPQEQERYQQRFDQWKDLSPDEQRQIDRKLDKWKNLSPSEKEDVRKRFR
jgi:hypothetical protein